MSDLVKRLLDADWNSQQRFLGSRIFGEAADRISQQDAELERVRRELADMTISRDGYAKQAMAREAEGRRKAFVEAAEIADMEAKQAGYELETAQHWRATEQRKRKETAYTIADAIRAKAEEIGS